MKKWMYYTLIGLLAVIFAGSAFFLGRYYLSSREQTQVYDDLAEMVEQVRATKPTQQAPAVVPGVPDATETTPVSDGGDDWITVTNPETGEPVDVLPEYAQLFTMNPDLVGWIRLPGTKLNYPVMQTPQNPDYYLKRNFHKESSSHGCIYVREVCDVFAPSDNLTMYGHYMKDGSMFAPLGDYASKAWWEEHTVLEFDTLKQRNRYEVFAVFKTTASVGKGFRYHTFIDATDQEDFDRFIATCKELSLYDTGITPQYGDKLITLSTCDYSQTNGRLVVVARLITE